jgi:cell division protein FtsA
LLDIPVRRGLPGRVGGLIEVVKSPAQAAAVGLLLFGLKNKKFTKASSAKEEVISESINSFGTRVKNFFEGIF